MAYSNFIPEVWAETIERELEKDHVFVADCNKQYEGNVSKMGDTVHILGTAAPTVKTQIGGDIQLTGAETVADSEVIMRIDHVSYFNYMIDDIDKRQAVGGVMDALSAEASQALADEQDRAVASLCTDKSLKTFAETVTKDNILAYIDKGLENLYKNNVKPDSEITMTVPPVFYMILKQAYTALDTDNSKMLENGKVGRYGNVVVRMSNNVATDKDGKFYIPIKTKKAFAFANPLTHTEPYRPENRFSDAVKGYVLYGSKIVRPKECSILVAKM